MNVKFKLLFFLKLNFFNFLKKIFFINYNRKIFFYKKNIIFKFKICFIKKKKKYIFYLII